MEPHMTWSYSEHFIPPAESNWSHPAIGDAEKYVVDTAIENHPFFDVAASRVEALRLWVSQELVVTNAVSQCMLRVAALMSNVHVRTRMVLVIDGEHMGFKNGVARGAHPWLLHGLRESLEIAQDSIVPLLETQVFLDQLNAESTDALRGTAAIGVGNERLLIPEYTAVRTAFEKGAHDSSFKGFLNANILEDTEHTRLMRVIQPAV
ncbi:MAG: hypothetical protein ACRDRI_00005 [Pseudonocardiaceae bacterium]